MIKPIGQVSCSLNLGFIYSVDYRYVPQEGVKINVSFVSEAGVYDTSFLSAAYPASIRIGSASFVLYPIRYQLSKSAGRKVISVDFVDGTFKLENYYIALTGRGCGQRVYQLGKVVDLRSLQQKELDSLDPVTKAVEDLTKFLDVEYHFSDFLTTLSSVFPVSVLVFYDDTLTKAYTGTFGTVLSDWCRFYNLAYFFENGVIKIFDPAHLTINFPAVPNDVLDYNETQSIEHTYGKTVWAHFAQEGKEIHVNNNLYLTMTLNQMGAEFNLSQQNVDMDQVTAAMHGKEYWFLYNFVHGTTQSQCGWTGLFSSGAVSISIAPDLASSVNALIYGRQVDGIATMDTKFFEAQYQYYRDYGTSIAGRYYLSDQIQSIELIKDYSWFDESQGQIFDLTKSDRGISIDYVTQPFNADGYVPGTVIDQSYPGVHITGSRLVYNDKTNRNYETVFALDNNQTALVNLAYHYLTGGIEGSPSVDFGSVNPSNSCFYYKNVVQIADLIGQLHFDDGTWNTRKATLGYANGNLPIKGMSRNNYNARHDAGIDSQGAIYFTAHVSTPTPASVLLSNTQSSMTKREAQRMIYCSKYGSCSSVNSGPLDAYGYRFESKDFSYQIPIVEKLSTNGSNVFTVVRDLSYINALLNSGILQKLAQPFTIPMKSMTFSFNYFRDIPVNFLTEGLTAMSINVSESGVKTTYTYSNEMLRVPVSEAFIEKIEKTIRNSWIWKYVPTQIVP